MPLELWAVLVVGLPVLGWAVFNIVKRQGRLEARNEQLERDNAVSAKQKDALANSPRDDAGIIDKLRGGKF